MKSRRKYIIPVAAGMLLAALLAVFDSLVFPLPAGKLHKPPAHFVYSREGRLLYSFSSVDRFWRKPVELDRISAGLREVVIACEDRWFFYHPGVNPIALLGALRDNLAAGRIVRGGSTITMQIARMMEPKPRTIGGKLIEVFRAFQLEWHYSKNELLEIYFNLVPYGGNIEGVAAATHFYFGKSPRELTLSEAAILAAIPSSPNNYRPDFHPENCRRRRDRILAYLADHGDISRRQSLEASREEIPSHRLNRPRIAPQFSHSIIAADPGQAVHRTTISFSAQTMCERLAGDHYRNLTGRDIHNLAVVVLDNVSGELLAMVGSPDFNDTRHGGQINGALAARSPGSALKPFVYALAMETGLITPLSKLDDIPVNYAGYTPDNYDETYHGLVTAYDALVQSFNVPAVNLTARVGLEEFYDFLRRGGLGTLDRKYYEYGLPLVLGACEVTLLELSNLYATLAREGLYRPVKVRSGSPATESQRILSAEACYLISHILSNLERPDLATSWEFTRDQPVVAWKTGTSYGRKDAWAIGYNPDHTVGVWCGNFNGAGSPYLVGADVAGPLMLAILRELSGDREIKWFDRPPGIATRLVCPISGKPPGDNCSTSVRDFYIAGVSSWQRCRIHRKIMVDRTTGYAVCPACAAGREIDTLIVEKWPARLSNWLISQGATQPLPAHNPQCRSLVDAEAPIIISPDENGTYEIRPHTPLKFQKILLEATAAIDCREVHWFIDDIWYASCSSDEGIFYVPEKGLHSLLCVDDFGRSSTISFEVK